MVQAIPGSLGLAIGDEQLVRSAVSIYYDWPFNRFTPPEPQAPRPF